MKSLVATAALCLLTQGLFLQGLLTQAASAQTRNCKALTDPLDRLTCNAMMNPQAAARQTPVSNPSQYTPRTRRELAPDSTAISGDDEMMVNRKINGICRGC